MALAVAFVSCKDKAAPASDATEAAAESTGKEYTVSTDAASISWVGSKPGGEHNGTVKVSNGTLSVENGQVTAGSFVIDMTSIEVLDLAGDEKGYLETHLKGLGKPEEADHFFNTAVHPQATFDIVSVMTATDTTYNTEVKGNLTIKGITKEVTIPANITVNDSIVVVTTEQFMINRTDYGVNFNSKSIFDNLGDKFINDEIKLQIMVEARAGASAPSSEM